MPPEKKSRDDHADCADRDKHGDRGERGVRRDVPLEGRVVAAGRASVELVGRLLGVARAGPGVRVSAVAWLDHALEAAVTFPGEPDGEPREVVFRVERASDDAEGMVRTRHLVLYYRGEELPERLRRTVERHAAHYLAEVTLEQLSARLAEDPELGKPGLPMPPGVDESDRPRSLLDTWGDEGAYADFLAGGEMARSQLDSLDPSSLFRFVQHSDAECIHVNPHCSAPVVWLVNYPWEDRIREEGRVHKPDRPADDFLDQMMTTDLTESDVIMGNPEKIDEVLDYAVRHAKALGKTLFFSNTCVPVVVGEDVDSRVDRARCRHDCPILSLTVTPRSMVNVFHDVLVNRRRAAENRAGPPDPRRVNLIGFPPGTAMEELRKSLDALGVHIGGVLLPDLREETVDRLPEAALNVFLPKELWQHLYDQLQFSSRIPFIAPQSPYGVDGTRRWLGEIVATLGLEVDRDEVWETLFAPHRAAWQRVREQARGHRLGLVVRGSESYYLSRPAATWGVPLVAMLEEAGFSLDVLLLVGDKKSAYRAAKQAHGVFREAGRHSIKGFNSIEMMLERLRDSPAEAVLSNHFFDWRVTGSGKNLFSLQHFEMGIGGAIRTAERLVAVCRTPFYRRFAKYLARTPQGLRVAAGGERLVP